MSEIRLGRHEVQHGQLPLVCMRCGMPAQGYRRHVFSYSPWWLYLGIPLALVPYLVLALWFNKRRSVHVPLCSWHQYHWLWREAALAAWLVPNFCISIIPPTFLLAPETVQRSLQQPEILIILVATLVCLAAWVGWFICALVLKYSSLHAVSLTLDSITLAGAAEEFVQALRLERESRDDGIRMGHPRKT